MNKTVELVAKVYPLLQAVVEIIPFLQKDGKAGLKARNRLNKD